MTKVVARVHPVMIHVRTLVNVPVKTAENRILLQ